MFDSVNLAQRAYSFTWGCVIPHGGLFVINQPSGVFPLTLPLINSIGEIEVKRCDTQFMTADIFTKAMSKELMDRHGSTICGGTPTLNCQHALAISI